MARFSVHNLPRRHCGFADGEQDEFGFHVFPKFWQAVWLPDRLTVIQEAARPLWGVTLPEVFDLDAPCALRLLSGSGSNGQQ